MQILQVRTLHDVLITNLVIISHAQVIPDLMAKGPGLSNRRQLKIAMAVLRKQVALATRAR